MKEHHATILKDPDDSSYTIAGTGDIMVNNQPATTRKLEPGDVIDVGGSTIVFEGEERNGAASAHTGDTRAETKGERRDRKRRSRK